MNLASLSRTLTTFVIDKFDICLRSIAEIEDITGLPTLAIVPRLRRSSARMAQGNIDVLTKSRSKFAKSFQTLQTSLLLSNTEHSPKFIVLTSAAPSEGKTTAACNLAAILAQQGNRCILIDGDLRRSSVHHRFRMNGTSGLTAVLTGATTLEEAVQTVPEISDLDILPSGLISPFPAEILSSEAMANLLKQCGELYTYVLIDTPPVLSVIDAVILAGLADAVVLVVRHGKSGRRKMYRTRDLLLRSRIAVTGILLNAVDSELA